MPGPVFIEGEDVSLRTIEEEDIPVLQEWITDRRIWRPTGRSWPFNREQEREWFEEVVCGDDSVELLISADADPLGVVGLDSVDDESRRAELGYWVAPEHQRQGYGTEAAALLVEHGFDQLGLHKITARVFAFNEPSRRVLERLGFVREGTHRDDVFVDGEFHDTYWYGLLAAE
jgi:RimJ/RimL family protein N-acetyltransferase